MKCILIAECDVCNKGQMVELDTKASKDGDHYPTWYATQAFGFANRNEQTMCAGCANRYAALIEGQAAARKNFK